MVDKMLWFLLILLAIAIGMGPGGRWGILLPRCIREVLAHLPHTPSGCSPD